MESLCHTGALRRATKEKKTKCAASLGTLIFVGSEPSRLVGVIVTQGTDCLWLENLMYSYSHGWGKYRALSSFTCDRDSLHLIDPRHTKADHRLEAETPPPPTLLLLLLLLLMVVVVAGVLLGCWRLATDAP